MKPAEGAWKYMAFVEICHMVQVHRIVNMLRACVLMAPAVVHPAVKCHEEGDS